MANKIDALKIALIAWIAQIKDLDVLQQIAALKTSLESKPIRTKEPFHVVKKKHTYQDIVAIAKQYPEDKKWTYPEALRVFPANLKVKVEILNNKLIIVASPSSIHQRISNKLSNKLTNFVEDDNLGEIFCAPMDTKFDDDNVEQPDIMFIAITRFDIIEENVINGAPDLVIEIISPANKKQEMIEKQALYERKGVKEYWTIHPKKRAIKVETLENNTFEIFSEGRQEGVIQSKLLEGFEIKIEDLMPESLFENVNKEKTKKKK